MGYFLTITLTLGVIDQLYDNNDDTTPKRVGKPSKRTKPIKAKGKTELVTTGMVAQILEDKYHIMQTFADMNIHNIAEDLEKSLQSALLTVMDGKKPKEDPYTRACEKINTRFKEFLSSGQIEGSGIDGVPTKAAIKRRSLRFKSKKANGERPSFIDTGLYEASFISWVK